MRSAMLLLLGAALCGCAGVSREGRASALETSYNEKAASWVGKTEKQLIRSLGEPTTSITVPGGDTFDEYRDAGCSIKFQIDPAGVVAGVVWKGAECASPGR